jgi:Integrase core domain
MQNGHIESFNGRMRDELLNESLFHRSRSGSLPHRCLGRRLQHREAAFLARLQNAGRLCRYTHRAEGLNIGRVSNRRRMKVQWQVICPPMTVVESGRENIIISPRPKSC